MLTHCKQLYQRLFDGLYREMSPSRGGATTKQMFRQLSTVEVEQIDLELDQHLSELSFSEAAILKRWLTRQCQGKTVQRWLGGTHAGVGVDEGSCT